jgi:hypothetical protein
MLPPVLVSESLSVVGLVVLDRVVSTPGPVADVAVSVSNPAVEVEPDGWGYPPDVDVPEADESAGRDVISDVPDVEPDDTELVEPLGLG